VSDRNEQAGHPVMNVIKQSILSS